LSCDKTTAKLILVRDLLYIGARTRESACGNAALEKVGMDAARLGVDKARVGLKVGAELLLKLAVLQEGAGCWVVHLQECPDLRVG
jgi:hypothetical protein